MQSLAFIDTINQELTTPVYARDIDSFLNRGYPILYWQLNRYTHTKIATDIDFTSVTANASISLSSPIPDIIQCGFEYREEGTTAWYTAVGTMTTDSTFSAQISEINFDCSVEYRAFVKRYGGAISYSEEYKTASVLNSNGSAITQEATDVTKTSANLHGYYYNGYYPTITSGFEFKKVSDSSFQSLYVVTTNDTMSYFLEGLSPETEYTYRAFLCNSMGTRYGELETFTTNSIGLNDEISLENQITLYPNPAKNEVIINSSNEIINRVEIFNLLEQMIYEKKVNNNTINIDVSKLVKGNYIAKIYSEDNGIISKKFFFFIVIQITVVCFK